MMRSRLFSPLGRQLPVFAVAVVAGLLGVREVSATEVKIFRTDRRDAFIEGELEGVAIDPSGALTLATGIERLTPVDEPFAYAAAPHPDGWVVGTGASGRVLLIDTRGAVRTLFETAAPNIFAVWVDQGGAVFAASSPNGAVYRLAAGAEAEDVETVFEPDAGYIWDLVGDGKGGLLVATGLPGRLYRLGRGGGTDQLLDTGDNHVRSVAVLGDGILIGTAGNGRVLLRTHDGTVRTLYDGGQPEVVDLAIAEDGRAYAALLASESSRVDLSSLRRPNGKTENSEEGEVEVTVQGEATVGSRPAGASGARSVLLAIDANGHTEQIWSHADDTIHSLLFAGGSLWLGTGEEGRLYRLQDDRMILEHDLDSRQITALTAPWSRSQGLPSLLTTNEAALHVLGRGQNGASGTYRSDVLDAGTVADFGTFFWHGDQPDGTAVSIAVRSGMAKSPDGTWTDWIPITGADRELALDGLAAGRFVQWRATLEGTAKRSPRLVRAELSYRQRNQHPEIKSFEVLDPGEVVVSSGFSPQNQTFEPWSPNKDGIFTTLEASNGKSDSARQKTLWKRGYRTLKWQAEDGNEDDLVFDLAFQPAKGTPSDDRWLPMATALRDSYFAFDATVLPDGVYRFRLTVSDREAQADRQGLTAVEISPVVVVDHAPPSLVSITRPSRGKTGRREIAVRDGASPLRDAVWSADGGKWLPAPPADGLLDGRAETLWVDAPEGIRHLLLRVTDAAWNVVTFDVLAAE